MPRPNSTSQSIPFPLLKLPLFSSTVLTDSQKTKTSIPKSPSPNTNQPNPEPWLSPDIWKRLFPARTRRPLPIIPQIGITRRFSPRMEINLFKLCSGLRLIGYFMILLVGAIIGVSYYAVVLLTCGPQLLRGGFHSSLSFTIIIIFHVLLILLLWSYFKVVFKDPGSVPENWRAVSAEDNLEVGSSLAAGDDGFGRRSRGGGGYCIRCQNGKPPRCHHCSVCQIRVLKMDHHCVWVMNCVGACNYKFFFFSCYIHFWRQQWTP